MLWNLEDNLNCLTRFLNHLPRQSSVIVWPSALCQDNIFVLPKEMTSAKTIRLSDRLDACKTILNCLAECILPRQSKIVWPNGFSKTIAIVLPKVNCLASFLIVFLLCLVLARQSEIVLPLLLCLCYSQLSCLSIVLQVQMLCL